MKQKDSRELKNIFNNLLKENKVAELSGLLLGLSEEEKKEIASNQDLFWPIEHDNLEMAKLLVEMGVDVNKEIIFTKQNRLAVYDPKKDDANQDVILEVLSSPLYKAAYNNQTELAKFLVEKGAMVNQEHDEVKRTYYKSSDHAVVRYQFEEKTALNLFVLHNNHEMVKSLIEQGANVGKRAEYKKGPLYSWTQHVSDYDIKRAKDFEMFKLLLPATLELDPKQYLNISRVTLEAAVRFGNLEPIKQVIDKIENKEAAFNQLLLFAIQYENPELVKYAFGSNKINLKADYNKGNILDYALEEANKINNTEITEILLNEISEGELKRYLSNKTFDARIKNNQKFIRENKNNNKFTVESKTFSINSVQDNSDSNSRNIEFTQTPLTRIRRPKFELLLEGNSKNDDCCNIL